MLIRTGGERVVPSSRSITNDLKDAGGDLSSDLDAQPLRIGSSEDSEDTRPASSGELYEVCEPELSLKVTDAGCAEEAVALSKGTRHHGKVGAQVLSAKAVADGSDARDAKGLDKRSSKRKRGFLITDRSSKHLHPRPGLGVADSVGWEEDEPRPADPDAAAGWSALTPGC